MSTHTRIRPFNTRDTYPEQNLDNDLCQAVIAGDTMFLRGQIAQNLDTSENVGVGDVTAQAEQAMTNIDLLLREAGSSLQDIAKVTVYLADPRHREPVYREMGRWLKGVYPVSTGLVVSALARPEWLVEIEATAVPGLGDVMTFSISARCPRTGEFGIAISSSSPAVAARCTHVRPGAGAAASQNITDPRSANGLDLLAAGSGPPRRSAGSSPPTPPPTTGNWRLSTPPGGSPASPAAARWACTTSPWCRRRRRRQPAGLRRGYRRHARRVRTQPGRHPRRPAAARPDRGAVGRRGGGPGALRRAGRHPPHAGWADTDLRVDWHEDPIGELAGSGRYGGRNAGLHHPRPGPGHRAAYGVPGDQ